MPTRSTASSSSRSTAHLRRLAGRGGRPRAAHAAVLRDPRNRGMYKDGWLLTQRLQRIPWDLDPEKLRAYGPGWNPDDEPIELYYLPDDFAQSKDVAADHPDKVKELTTLLGRGRGQQRPAAARRTDLLLRHGAADPGGVDVRFPRRHPEHLERDDPADLQPFVHDQRRPGDSRGRRGRRDRRGGRPSRRLRALRPGREAQAHYSMLGVLKYTQAAEPPLPTGEVSVEMVFAADAPKPATGGEVDAGRERRAGRHRADGAHRARPLLGLLRHGHRPRQRPGRRPQLRGQGAVRLHRRDQARHLRRRPGPERRKRKRHSTSTRSRRSRPTLRVRRRSPETIERKEQR